MSNVRRWVAVLLACLLTAACGGAAGVPTAEPPVDPSEAVASPTAAPESTPTPTPAADPVTDIAPLTGMPSDDLDLSRRPVLALKIDNHPLARPQTALASADIVFEELVEGGVTRFVALYHSELPDSVGPVRSGREVDADLLPAFDPVLGMSGAATVVHGLLQAVGLLVFEEGQTDGFFRRPDLPRPHNLFAVPENLVAAGAGLPAAQEPWVIEADGPAGGTPITAAHVELSPYADADWTWDEATGAWQRAEDGSTHTDALGGTQTAATVVVMEVEARPGTRTDAGGNRTVDIDVIGEGDATVLRDGRAHAARWRKDGAGDHLVWTTPGGDPLPLAPGRTWIELMPVAGALTVRTATGEQHMLGTVGSTASPTSPAS